MARPFSLLAPDARYRVDEIKLAEVPPEVTKLTSQWADEIRNKMTDSVAGTVNQQLPQLPQLPETPEFRLPPNNTPFTNTALAASAILGPAALAAASTAYPAYRATRGVLNATPGDAPRYAIRGATDGLGTGVGGVLGGGAGFMAGDAIAKSNLDASSPILGNSARILGLLAGASLGGSAGKQVSRTVLPLSQRERDEEKQGQEKQAVLAKALPWLVGAGSKIRSGFNAAKPIIADGAKLVGEASGPVSSSAWNLAKPYVAPLGRAAMGGAGGYITGSEFDQETGGYGGLGGALAGAAANVMHHRGLGKLVDGVLPARRLSSTVRDVGMRSITGQGIGYLGDTALQGAGLEDPESFKLRRMGALAGAGSAFVGRKVPDQLSPMLPKPPDAGLAGKFNRFFDEGPLGGGSYKDQVGEFGRGLGTARWLSTTMPGAAVTTGVPVAVGMAGNYVNNKLDEKARGMADTASQQFASNLGMSPAQMQQMGGMVGGMMNPLKSLASGVMGQSNVPSFISQLTPSQQLAIMGGLGMGAYGAYTGNVGLGAAGAGLAAAPMAYNYMAGAQPDYRRMSQTANPQQAGTY